MKKRDVVHAIKKDGKIICMDCCDYCKGCDFVDVIIENEEESND